MPLVIDDKHVRIDNCFVVWDGITQPEAQDGGGFRWSLKVVTDPNNPDLAILNQLAQAELQSSEFQGVLPPGGLWPVAQAGPSDFGGVYNGWAVIKTSTYKLPDVYDEMGARMDPMQYGQLLYGGQMVGVMVHAKAYNNKSKGVAARLDGFDIRVSANAPKQAFGGMDTSSAFGGTPAQQPGMQPMAQPGMQPGVQPGMQPMAQPGMQPGQQPMAQPGMQPGQQPMAQPGMQPGQQPMAQPGMQPGQQPMAQPGMQPAQQPGNVQGGVTTGATSSPSDQYPQQAHNFLPQQ